MVGREYWCFLSERGEGSCADLGLANERELVCGIRSLLPRGRLG